MSTGETPPPSRKRRFWQRLQGDDPDARVPRGVVAVVAIGVLACFAVPVLRHLGGTADEFAHLYWVQSKPIPDSKPVAVPGGKQEMQLVNGGIRSTGTNVEGYSVFRVLSTLKIEKNAPIAGGHAICSTKAASGDEITRTTGNLRATFPRSSEAGIYGQAVPEKVEIGFASHGHKYAILEVGDLPERFTTVRGVKLEWPEYEVGIENLDFELPPEATDEDIELPFYTIWRTQKEPPAATISCTVKTSAGSATVKTAGKLATTSPPIDEEAEAATQEAKEESEDGSAAEESTEAEEGEE